jgi:hypothetical protein
MHGRPVKGYALITGIYINSVSNYESDGLNGKKKRGNLRIREGAGCHIPEGQVEYRNWNVCQLATKNKLESSVFKTAACNGDGVPLTLNPDRDVSHKTTELMNFPLTGF